MDKPAFSVMIPAHNEEKNIGKCIRAVISASEYISRRQLLLRCPLTHHTYLPLTNRLIYVRILHIVC